MIEIKIVGLDKLKKRLKDIPAKYAKVACRKAAREGAKIIKAIAKDDYPTKTGKTRRSLKVRSIKRNRSGWIGAKVSVGDKAAENFIPKFLEFGTKKMTAKEPLRKAARKGEAAARRTFIDVCMRVIDEQLKRK